MRRVLAVTLGLAALGTAAACAPPGGGGGPALDLEVVSVRTGGDNVSPGLVFENDTITVTNSSLLPTSGPVTFTLDPPSFPGAGGFTNHVVDAGTCDDGPLFAGQSCTASVQLAGSIGAEVTITADAGLHSGSTVEAITSNI